MKILLTGATGFLGSWLLRSLICQGHEVIALKRSFSDCRRINGLIDKAYFYDVDLCPLEEIFIKNRGIECVIHTATCYGRGNESAFEVFEANTVFPMRLLSAATRNGSPPSFLNMSTFLPKPDYGSYGFPYVNSKRQFSEWGRFLSENGNIRFVDVVLEHMYGPFDGEAKFIPYVISSCINNIPFLNLTEGGQKRDFIYVDDVIRGIVAILKNLPDLKTGFYEYGLGTGEAVPIRRAAETIAALCESDTELRFGAVPYREGELMFSQADTRPLRELGWAPEISFEQGIRKTLEIEFGA